jgi:hypothetical protein
LVPSLTIPDVARLPFDGREDALVLGRVGSFSNLLGSGAVQSCRNLVDQRGVDPAAIRGAVEANAGAPMTPLPAGSIWDEIRVVGQVGDGLRVRCPIWTQTGRSGLAMEIIVERTEFGSLYVDALVDDRGDTVMSTADAPAADQPVGVGPPGEEPIAAGGDPRIRRKAFVGASYGRASSGNSTDSKTLVTSFRIACFATSKLTPTSSSGSRQSAEPSRLATIP